jgi:hypothetical protein
MKNIKKVYEKFKNLDTLLSNPSIGQFNNMSSELWIAIKKDLGITKQDDPDNTQRR